MRSRLLRFTATTVLAVALAASPAFAQSESAEFEKGVVAFDAGKYEEAIEHWEPLAEAGNVEALRNLAQLYRLGLGVEQDDAKAFELYEMAAQRGLAAAQVNAAFLLLTGKGVEQDRATAATWFAKAADQGNALAQYNLGLMYEKGIGVKQNDGYALELYRAAADQGQKRAIARLEAMDDEGGTEVAAKSDSETGDNAKRPRPDKSAIAEEIGSEGKEMAKRPRPDKSAIAEGMSSEGEEIAKRPRPDKSEVAEGVESAGAEMAAKSDADAELSIEPADEEEVTEQPLEFEIAEAESVAPETTSVPGGKPASDKEAASEESAPQPAYTMKVDASDDSGDEATEAAGESMAKPDPADDAADPETDAVETVALDSKKYKSSAASRVPTNRVERIKQAEAAYEDKDFALTAELLGPLADSGVPIAQFWMGRLFNRGEGVDLDRVEAYSLWRAAAVGGSQRAATALANLSSRLTPDEIASAEAHHASTGRPR